MNSAVHLTLAAMLSLPAIGCAQALRSGTTTARASNGSHAAGLLPAQKDDSADDTAPRRLQSVTWNSVTHELTWDVAESGSQAGDGDHPGTIEHYLISLDDATMTYQGETRRFSTQEAANVHVLMDVVAKYAADSTNWWDEGQGEPVNGAQPKEHKPAPPAAQPDDSDDDDNVAFLQASARTSVAADPAALHAEIRRLERRLAELKRLERSAAANRAVLQ